MFDLPDCLTNENYNYESCPSVSWIPSAAVTSEQVQEALIALKKGTSYDDKSISSTTYSKQCHIWLAYLNFSMWKHGAAIQILDQIDSPPPMVGSHLGSAMATSFIMSKLIRAWCLQKLGQLTDSLEPLSEIYDYVSSARFAQDEVDFFVKSEQSMLHYWIECAIFTHIMTHTSLS